MIDELNKAIEGYQTKWQALIAARTDRTFFEDIKPVAAGWKTEDLTDFDKRFACWRERAEQAHLVWLNERWIATIILKDAPLAWGIQIIKLLQRRPGSSDASGLDHLDFYAPRFGTASVMQTKESDLQWTDETNGMCAWTSLWFDDTEAKLRRESVLDVCIKEMSAANERILGKRL